MKYTVLWTLLAEQELAAIWIAALDRNAITAAANQIDKLLASNPESRGVLRFDTVRTMNVAPLGVDFEIDDANRIVYVLTVWDLNATSQRNGSASD